MSVSLAGRVAVVTGGAQGIGRGICERLLAAGARVVVGDLNAPTDSEDWLSRVSGAVSWRCTDVTASDSIAALAEHLADEYGALRVLVNNAGIMLEKRIDEQSEADWDRTIAVDLKGPFLVTRGLLPLLRSGATGGVQAAIINIGSVEGVAANPGHIAYCASKGGVYGLTVANAIDLGPDSICVNAIAPGWIDTDLNREYIESVDDETLARAESARLHPVGYIGELADIKDVAVWLAGDESRFVSGQVIAVDGARTWQLSLPVIFFSPDFGIADGVGEP